MLRTDCAPAWEGVVVAHNPWDPAGAHSPCVLIPMRSDTACLAAQVKLAECQRDRHGHCFRKAQGRGSRHRWQGLLLPGG